MADCPLLVPGSRKYDLVSRRVNADCSVSDNFLCVCDVNPWLIPELAEVFGKSSNADTVAAQWLSQYQRNNGETMRDLVNFILRCTGTDLEIDINEVEDIDNAPGRIGDLQNLYQAEGITEYSTHREPLRLIQRERSAGPVRWPESVPEWRMQRQLSCSHR